MQKFQSQRLNPHPRSDLSCCSGNARSLTHCSARELFSSLQLLNIYLFLHFKFYIYIYVYILLLANISKDIINLECGLIIMILVVNVFGFIIFLIILYILGLLLIIIILSLS